MAQSLVYGIDVGTTKVVAIAGKADSRRGWVEILALGEAPSRGMRRGVVVERQAATESIAQAIEACGVPMGPVSVGIAGGHITSFNAEIAMLNRSRDRTITQRFIRRMEHEIRQVHSEPDEQVIHVVPRSYVLDGEEGIKQPLGLAARQVTMRAHVVSGAVSSIQNLLQAVEDCGIRVARVVLEPLASSEACLLEPDREMGVVLIDIGGGTTDIATFWRGALTHTAVIPIGGESFSSDVAYGLKIPLESAEKLKLRYGTVLSHTLDSVAAVKLGDRHYNAYFLSQILEFRALEIFEMVRDSLDEARVRNLLPGGIVLTGGGSLLDGMPQLAEETLGMRARIATPRRVKGDIKPIQEPQYSTSIGLLHFAAKNNNPVSKSDGASVTTFGSIVSAIKGWFGGG